MNFLSNRAATGVLSSGQQSEAAKAGIKLNEDMFRSVQDDMDRRRKEIKDSMTNCWESGFKAGRKIKVHLRKVGADKFSYKITFGSSCKPLNGTRLTKDPVKAIENGHRRVAALLGNE